MRNVTVQNLLNELRALSGIAEMEEGGVDWMVPTDAMDSEDIEILEAMGMRRLQEQSSAKIDASIRESLKGTIETLAKRMEGVIDLVDLGKLPSVQTALAKIMKDTQALFDSLDTSNKKAAEGDKKAKQKQDQDAQQDQQADASDKGQKQQGGGQTTSKGANQAPAQQGGGGAAPEQQAQPAQPGAQEGYVLIGSELIMESSMKDPFGLGEGFKKSIAKMGLIPVKHREQ